VDLSKITWAPTHDEHVAEFEAPANVDYSFRGKPMQELLLSGQVDAAIGDIRMDSPEIRPLIPDARNAGFAYFRKTGIYPINHAVVIANSVLEAEPWVAEELFWAFKAAKGAYLARLNDEALIERSRVVGDPFPFGVNPNRKALDALIQFAVDQRVIPSRVSPKDLFPPGMLDLE
jgi:4,5-dihydroxyphthalate decarboxylase